MEEITSLEPGQTARGIIQVRFYHHLLPLKLALFCNGKKIPVKLRPDIGYFVKPLPMDIEAFTDKESRLPGMFEYARRSVTILNNLIVLSFLLFLSSSSSSSRCCTVSEVVLDSEIVMFKLMPNFETEIKQIFVCVCLCLWERERGNCIIRLSGG